MGSEGSAPRGFSREWWLLGGRPKPWAHAALAFGAGAALYAIAQYALVALFVVGPLLASGFAVLGVIIAAITFGALGVGFLGRASGGWLAFTSLAWAGGSALAFALGLSSRDGQLDRWLWFPPLLAGIIPFAIALLAHRGPTRAIAGLLLAVAATTGIVALAVGSYDHHLAEGQRRFGSTVRPEVTTVAGTQPAQVLAYPGSSATVGRYLTAKRQANGDYPVLFTLLTEPRPGSACGAPLAGNSGTEAEMTCSRSGKLWIRTSATRHEVAAVLDGYLVRAVGSTSTSESLLRAAIDHARPMSAWDYEALLNDQF
ncbi:hypothetical protein ACFPJ4_12810 [Lysinimonas soli]|uniref:Uncharacterized protein n=1 Tax=Lysinimonas soli TaxID=1074233 RepID=A0ABW0NUW4_9MICO